MRTTLFHFVCEDNGMEKEYEKILDSERFLFIDNGGNKEALEKRYDELRLRKERYLEQIETMMLDIALCERVLRQISNELTSESKETS